MEDLANVVYVKSFLASSSDLNNHRRTHTGEKTSRVSIHQRTYIGEQPFERINDEKILLPKSTQAYHDQYNFGVKSFEYYKYKEDLPLAPFRIHTF